MAQKNIRPSEIGDLKSRRRFNNRIRREIPIQVDPALSDLLFRILKKLYLHDMLLDGTRRLRVEDGKLVLTSYKAEKPFAMENLEEDAV